MLQIDKMSRQPIYEQIVEQIELQVLTGILKSGDKISSVRELSSILGINPNTIQKAFLELDRKGVIASSPGLGSFITANALQILRNEQKSRLLELESLVSSLALANISKEDILEAVERAYNKKFGKERY